MVNNSSAKKPAASGGDTKINYSQMLQRNGTPTPSDRATPSGSSEAKKDVVITIED